MVVVEKQPICTAHPEQAKALKQVLVFWHNLSGMDFAVCARRIINVQSTDRSSNRLAAEHALMLMLALTHDLDAARSGANQPSPLAPSN